MVGRDAALASLFYNNGVGSYTVNSTKAMADHRNSMLTMENMKLHDRHTQDANNKFYPRINKLVDVANRRFN